MYIYKSLPLSQVGHTRVIIIIHTNIIIIKLKPEGITFFYQTVETHEIRHIYLKQVFVLSFYTVYCPLFNGVL